MSGPHQALDVKYVALSKGETHIRTDSVRAIANDHNGLRRFITHRMRSTVQSAAQSTGLPTAGLSVFTE